MTTNNNHNHPLTDAVDSIATAVDEALVIAVDSRSPDALLARLATARAGIVKVDLITHVIDIPGDTPRVYADELPPGAKPKALDLPKLQKQPKRDMSGYVERPGIGKKKRRPREFACVTCGAEAGTSCFYMTSQGKNAKVTDQRRPDEDDYYHATRRALSKAANDKLRAAYDREHFGDPA